MLGCQVDAEVLRGAPRLHVQADHARVHPSIRVLLDSPLDLGNVLLVSLLVGALLRFDLKSLIDDDLGLHLPVDLELGHQLLIQVVVRHELAGASGQAAQRINTEVIRVLRALSLLLGSVTASGHVGLDAGDDGPIVEVSQFLDSP